MIYTCGCKSSLVFSADIRPSRRALQALYPVGMTVETPPLNLADLRERNLSVTCPDCGDRMTLDPAAGPVNIREHGTSGAHLSYFVGRCPNTKRSGCKPVFAVYNTSFDRIVSRYPIPAFDADSMDKAIPDAIREDYAEARRCGYVSAFKGAVALYRRVVEATACHHLGTAARDTKGRTKLLSDLIDALHSDGLITKDLKESAHEVRLLGNYGAHVQDDGLDRVTSEEVESVREIAWQLLHTLFVAPAKTAQLREKRQQKGKSAPQRRSGASARVRRTAVLPV